MILLQAVVQISARPVLHFSSQCPAYSAWVRVVSISRYLLGLMTNHLLGSLEEALGRLHVPMFRNEWREPSFPVANCFMRELEASLQEHHPGGTRPSPGVKAYIEGARVLPAELCRLETGGGCKGCL